jgi:hypothetical protein
VTFRSAACKFEGHKSVQCNQILLWILMLQSSPFVALSMLSIVIFGIGVARLAMINVNTSCKLLDRPQNTWENILHLSWKFVMEGNFIMQKLFVLFPNTARSGPYVNAIKKYSDIAGVSIHTSHYFLNQASQSLIEVCRVSRSWKCYSPENQSSVHASSLTQN